MCVCVCVVRGKEREKVSVYVCAVCVCLVRMAQSVERQACDQKVAGTLLSRNEGRSFLSGVNFLYCPLFGVCSTPVLWQLHAKDLSRSPKSAGF